jgi:hypothetical protein
MQLADEHATHMACSIPSLVSHAVSYSYIPTAHWCRYALGAASEVADLLDAIVQQVGGWVTSSTSAATCVAGGLHLLVPLVPVQQVGGLHPVQSALDLFMTDWLCSDIPNLLGQHSCSSHEPCQVLATEAVWLRAGCC